jgi:hypothetical protein
LSRSREGKEGGKEGGWIVHVRVRVKGADGKKRVGAVAAIAEEEERQSSFNLGLV